TTLPRILPAEKELPTTIARTKRVMARPKLFSVKTCLVQRSTRPYVCRGRRAQIPSRPESHALSERPNTCAQSDHARTRFVLTAGMGPYMYGSTRAQPT